MCHLLKGTANLRWSVLSFRNHHGQLRYLTLHCNAFPSLSHRVAVSGATKRSFEIPSKAARGTWNGPFVQPFHGDGQLHGKGDFLGFKHLLSRDRYLRSEAACLCEGFESDEDEDVGGDGGAAEAGEEYIVVNFYHFVEVDDPHEEVARHTAFMEGRNIRGRIYINHQGINAQLSGPRLDAMAYANWVKEDERFSPTYIQISPSPRGHAFPRLKLRYKPSLVQVCASEGLPLTDPSTRAVPLTPKQWREKLEERSTGGPKKIDDREAEGGLQNMKRVLLLDVRNGYEWDVGHFQGASRPEVECFKSTEFGLSDVNLQEAKDDPLAGVDKENVDVMMYCTGGIRCDVYSTMLRQKGFKNLFTLRGGVAKYLKEEGTSQWNGRLFVFDSRLSVPPVYYHGGEENRETDDNKSAQLSPARCFTCGTPIESVHRNCANLDCNRLYLSCPECVAGLQGCCCDQCMNAPRLRPVLSPDETYERWHTYREPPPPPPRPPGWISRRALKRQRRKERRREAELVALAEKSNVVDAVGT